jgi:CheY-like chemotaxis protein
MNGDIHVSSELNHGSRFWFELALPLTALLAEPQPENLTSALICAYEGPRKGILIVDDVEPNREVLKDMLTPLGFDVRCAESGLEAVEQVQANPPDLIIMDLAMPGMGGLEATRRIRWGDLGATVPIVALSAHASETDRQGALDAGANAFMVKPFDRQALLDQLAGLMQLTWVMDR